jgi:hypothetical protein
MAVSLMSVGSDKLGETYDVRCSSATSPPSDTFAAIGVKGRRGKPRDLHHGWRPMR